uniref:Uncharacterized protein n=1 Tax=Timema shepardi TaxID=629360 RepID=A0A7R9B2W2_TIMSH|nr:unnamed protein product [Timema shepardi]
MTIVRNRLISQYKSTIVKMLSLPNPTQNMSEVCRLCLSAEEDKLPIFAEEDSFRTPLYFRILACVSVEVSKRDGLPTQICRQCLHKVNLWHDFKRVCDSSQERLKEWFNQTHTRNNQPRESVEHDRLANALVVLSSTAEDGEIEVRISVVIKQETIDVEEDDDMIEITRHDEMRESSMIEIKQEEIEVCDDDDDDNNGDADEFVNAIEIINDPLSFPSSKNNKSPLPLSKTIKIEPEDPDVQHVYDHPVLIGDYSGIENGDTIDLNGVNHSGALSMQGIFDPERPIKLEINDQIPNRRKRRRKYFKRITVKKKPKIKQTLWANPKDIVSKTQDGCKCRKCGDSFPDLCSLKTHEKVHAAAENVCTICDKRYSSKGCLVRHIRIHTGQKPYICSICKKSFPYKSAYTQHRNNCSELINATEIKKEIEQDEDNLPNANTYSCYVCEKPFPNVNQMISHRRSHSSFSCHKCKKMFAGGTGLSNHLRTHTNVLHSYLSCFVCWKSFKSKLALEVHKRVHKKVLTPPSIAKTVINSKLLQNNADGKKPTNGFVCEVCDKWFKGFNMLTRHMISHTKSKEFACTLCSSTMGYASSLHKHMQVVHNINIDYKQIKPNNLSSPAMKDNKPKFITAASAQINDQQASTQSGNHVCTICTKSFPEKSMLVSHIKIIHMGVKAYKCSVCSKMFASRIHLVKHMDSHSENLDELSCKICLKQFPDLKRLNLHKGVHKRFKFYKCDICLESFNGLKAWNNHQMAHAFRDSPLTPLNDAPLESCPTGTYTCRLCFKMFTSRSDLYEHKKMHIKLKIFSCSHCKNSYNSSSALTKHKIRNHRGGGLPINPFADPRKVNRVLNQERLFVCEICSKPFNNSSGLSKHRLQHADILFKNVKQVKTVKPTAQKNTYLKKSVPATKEGTFVCEPCNRSFNDWQSFTTHKGWHTRKHAPLDRMLPLKDTPSPVKNSPAVDNNVVVHKHKCNACAKMFSTPGRLSQHEQSCPIVAIKRKMAIEDQFKKPSLKEQSETPQDKNKKVECSVCHKMFANKKALIRHKGWHSRSPNSRLKSYKLEFSQFSKDENDTPIQETPLFIETPLVETPLVEKQLLPETPLADVKTLSGAHDSSPIGVQCDICEKYYSSTSTLYRHRRLHLQKQIIRSRKTKIMRANEARALEMSLKGQSVSEDLPKVRASISNMEHFDTTELESKDPLGKEGKEEFSCSLCSKVFKMEEYLKAHIRIHTGERPYPCDQCPLAFSRASNLWKHKRTHVTRPFSCQICRKRFALKYMLIAHTRKAHAPKEDVFACLDCDRTYSSLGNLSRHRKYNCH